MLEGNTEGEAVAPLVSQLALGFHQGVIDMVVNEALRQKNMTGGLEQVVLCGGVFANRILLECCYERLTAMGFRVYYNEQVSPGDGGISLGQAYYGSLYYQQKLRQGLSRG